MSAYHQIFIRTDKSEHDFMADLRSATGADIRASPPGSSAIAYFGSLGQTAIEVELEHDFEKDHGMDFGAYPVLVTIRELDAETSEEERVARDVFEKLRSIGGHDLLLVFDLQGLVAKS